MLSILFLISIMSYKYRYIIIRILLLVVGALFVIVDFSSPVYAMEISDALLRHRTDPFIQSFEISQCEAYQELLDCMPTGNMDSSSGAVAVVSEPATKISRRVEISSRSVASVAGDFKGNVVGVHGTVVSRAVK